MHADGHTAEPAHRDRSTHAATLLAHIPDQVGPSQEHEATASVLLPLGTVQPSPGQVTYHPSGSHVWMCHPALSQTQLQVGPMDSFCSRSLRQQVCWP